MGKKISTPTKKVEKKVEPKQVQKVVKKVEPKKVQKVVKKIVNVADIPIFVEEILLKKGRIISEILPNNSEPTHTLEMNGKTCKISNGIVKLMTSKLN